MRNRAWLSLRAATAGALFAAASVHAQMIGVEFQAQAQMATKGGNVSGCGISFTAAYIDGGDLQGISGSVLLFLTGASGIKAGLFDMARTGNREAPFSKTPSAYAFAWARADNTRGLAPASPEQIIQSDDVGYKVFAVTLQDGANLLLALSSGERLWLGFKSPSGHERIFNGHIRWLPGSEVQYHDCITQLLSAMETSRPSTSK